MLRFSILVNGVERLDYEKYIDANLLPYEGFVQQEMDAVMREISTRLANELRLLPDQWAGLDTDRPMRRPPRPARPTQRPGNHSERSLADSLGDPDVQRQLEQELQEFFGKQSSQGLGNLLGSLLDAEIRMSVRPGTPTLYAELKDAGTTIFPTRVALLNSLNCNRGFSDLYNSVGVSKQTFSNLMSYDDKGADRDNVLRIACAVKAGVEDAEFLLRLKGYAFRPHIKEDIILRHCFVQRIHDPHEINDILLRYECKPLFWAT